MTTQARRTHRPSHLFATGQAVFTDDVPVPADTLYIALGLSDIARGRIVSMNLDAVRSGEGVVDVLTAAQIPGINRSSLLGSDPVFVATEVEYSGQCLFAVVAHSEAAAHAAARQAQVHYEEFTAIVTIDQARAAGEVLCAPLLVTRGDATESLAGSPHQLHGVLSIGGQEHFYMETQVTVAFPEDDGQVRLVVSTQHPSDVQILVANTLGVSANDITVQCPRLGGGFGGKETQAALFACIAAIACVRTRRAVKLRMHRREDMRNTGKRHDMVANYSAGFTAAGLLQALSVRLDMRCGFSNDLSIAVATRALLHVDNAYFITHVRLQANLFRTHTASNTAFRGFGAPQAMLLIEHILDDIATVLDLDPVTVRQSNYYGIASRNQTPYGMTVRDNILTRLTDEILESSRYAIRRQEIQTWNDTHSVLKRGIAFTPVKFGIAFSQTFLNQGAALLHVYTDGSILVSHGGTEMGQGLSDKISHVVERSFGVDPVRIRVATTDTTRVPNASPTAASASSDLNGHAAVDAVNQVKKRLLLFAAHHYSCALSECSIHNDLLHLGERTVSFDELIDHAHKARISLSATGFYATPDIHFDPKHMVGQPFFYFVYGVAVSEVVVDVLTGEHRLLQVDILQDAGQSLDPVVDLGQIEGGFMQGVGWLTMEELVWSESGTLLTDSPATYKIPTSHDIPPIFNVRLTDWTENRVESLFRSKGIGEPPLPLAISTFLAVKRAITGNQRSLPVLLNAPATPANVIDALTSRHADNSCIRSTSNPR